MARKARNHYKLIGMIAFVWGVFTIRLGDHMVDGRSVAIVQRRVVDDVGDRLGQHKGDAGHLVHEEPLDVGHRVVAGPIGERARRCVVAKLSKEREKYSEFRSAFKHFRSSILRFSIL